MRKKEYNCERYYDRYSPVGVGIKIFREGLECCCLGLHQAESCNYCRAQHNTREGLAMCERGYDILCRCLGNDKRRELNKGLRKCRWGLNEIYCGYKEIACHDYRDGIADEDDGIECCKLGLSMIENVEEACDCGC